VPKSPLRSTTAGQIVVLTLPGTGSSAEGGALLSRGAVTQLGIAPTDINESGQVAGFLPVDTAHSSPVPAVWANGTVTVLGKFRVGVGDQRQRASRSERRSRAAAPRSTCRCSTRTGRRSICRTRWIRTTAASRRTSTTPGRSSETRSPPRELDEPHAVTWTDDVATDLGAGEANSINDAGQIVGTGVSIPLVGSR